MRLVIQRVKKASVKVVKSKKIFGKIDNGLFILVGIGENDTEKEAYLMAEKVAKMRIMSDNKGKMNLSVRDLNCKVLVVSQFTLYADTSGGNRPSFIKAALPNLAKKVYVHFVTKLKELGIKVETGSFGDYMEINCILDGPVTIILES